MDKKEKSNNNLFKDNSNKIWISYYDDSTIYNAETKQEIPTISRGQAELQDIHDGLVFLQTPENILIIPIHRVLKIKKPRTQKEGSEIK